MLFQRGFAFGVQKNIRLDDRKVIFQRVDNDTVAALSALRDGDRVLIAEACTHRRTCGDIGTVKLPRMIEKYTGGGSLLSPLPPAVIFLWISPIIP